MQITVNELFDYANLAQLQLIRQIIDLRDKHIIIDEDKQRARINGDTFFAEIQAIEKEIEGYC